jgi:bifunctional non-homologous end joining protein LigD
MLGRLDQPAVQAIQLEFPFLDTRPIPQGTRRTRPELLAPIGFAEWTNDRRLRQPRFLGLLDDKLSAEVVRDRAR